MCSVKTDEGEESSYLMTKADFHGEIIINGSLKNEQN